jgi:HNH endonuclease
MSQQESDRQPISKSIRFEIFKRDKFTCQYCGNKAPDIILHVDHINPVSKGGTNDLLNLITSCIDCNLGKSNRTLADTTIIDRKRTQMEELQERREQIEMMMEWQRGLVEIDRYLVEQIGEFWAELVDPYRLNEEGLKGLKKLLRQHNADEIMEAMRVATKQYLQYDNNQLTQESVSHAWSKIGGICKTKKIEKSKPYMRDLFYIRGILRKRLNYLNEWQCLKLLEKAYQCGADLEKLKEHACNVRYRDIY